MQSPDSGYFPAKWASVLLEWIFRLLLIENKAASAPCGCGNEEI